MNLRLYDLRIENDLKQKDIANDLNIGFSTYSEWENNKSQITIYWLNKLGEYYKLNIDYIVGISNNKINIYSKNSIDYKIIGKRMREMRKILKISQQELSKTFNYFPSTISRYENGKSSPSSSILIYLCKKSNYSIDWILGRSNDKYLK